MVRKKEVSHAIRSRISDILLQDKAQVGTRLRMLRLLYVSLRDHYMDDAQKLDGDFFGSDVMALVKAEDDVVKSAI